jgi:ATP-binding cassette subfamily B protein/subfamily B ATP-binding cassette protein MsbA
MRWLKPHRYAVAALLLIALVGAGLEMVEPLFMRFMVDGILLNTGLDASSRMDLHLTGLVFL